MGKAVRERALPVFSRKDHCSGKEASIPRRTTWAWTFVMSCEGGTGNRVMGLIGRLADSERAAKTKGGLAGRPENRIHHSGIYFFEGFFFP